MKQETKEMYEAIEKNEKAFEMLNNLWKLNLSNHGEKSWTFDEMVKAVYDRWFR